MLATPKLGGRIIKMGYKKKGQLTTDAERRKHLRKTGKRFFWKRERKAEKEFIENFVKDESTQVKVLFRFFSNIFDEDMVETMWADVVDETKGLYKLENIPFYVPSVAYGDTIFAEVEPSDEMLTYRETVEYSGNSTIQVVLMNEKRSIESIRDEFLQLGASSERISRKYFSMGIPSECDYGSIKPKLEEYEQQGLIGYAEPCLSDIHRSQI